MHERNEMRSAPAKILKACGIDICTAFEALDGRQIDALLAHLDQHRFNKYGPMSKLRQPPGSVNSRVRL
ncbi:hypothetical protein EJ069_32535 [Mesorhizobium sp. M2A.F.Ca.ET.043.05.1.1]|uniref:hypothetical protein n=1 Tax=Mesorhizobium sp. M2A.F.Ca.ET.043.05.1.1 TaxID=2493671 RepID=UPI000F74F3B0|nr:hypothetical protein [Mesorhizobium sp. M2A.F.Ca.ET.043.05.1.1]AZO18922.1 hypothetical protein EJ069_32535 [Mesorhizobium sp. M2A.F.Ca.ET.043.05.1.1]